MLNILSLILLIIACVLALWMFLKNWWENEGQENPEDIYIFAAMVAIGFIIAGAVKAMF